LSTLQVANVHFESTGGARIDRVGTTINIVSPTTNVSGNIYCTAGVTASNVSIGNVAISTTMGPYKNKIINGNFDIWQRGTSNGMSGYYTADRWSCQNSGTTKTASRQSFTLGQTAVPGEPTYFMRHVVTSSAGAGNFCYMYQVIESVRTLAGKTATLSFWAKADSSKNIAIDMSQYFGSGGSPSSSVLISPITFALTSSWQKFIYTFSFPSISGKTLGSDNNDGLGINFWFDAGSTYNSRNNSLGQQSGTFDIAQVQLEEGPVATAFEQRHIGQETLLCMRYFRTVLLSIRGKATAGSDTFSSGYLLSPYMRIQPTATVRVGGTNGNLAGLAFGSGDAGSFRYEIVSLAAGDTYSVLAEYNLDAEL